MKDVVVLLAGRRGVRRAGRTPRVVRVLLLGALSAAPGCGDDNVPGAIGADAGAGPPTCTGKPGAAGDHEVTVTSGGRERTARLHVPAAHDPERGAMLVIDLHFYSGNPELEASISGMRGASDERGFLVAHPAGVSGSWNAGQCCGDAWTQGIDDVQFIRDLIAAIEADYCVDPARIAATGLSNGGFMAYRLGCDLADRIAAIAPVAAALHAAPGACAPPLPVSVIHFHGTGDAVVPYGGGPGMSPISVAGELDFISAPSSVALFRGADGCSEASEEVYSRGGAACEAWSACDAGSAVELCTIEGGGHTWPSGGPLPPFFGETSADIRATDVMIDFFEAHPGAGRTP